MTPRVAVVMAAKDYARFLPEAVESVLAQTVGDWELMIVDDGSRDGTPAAIRPFLSDKRIRAVTSDRLGQSRAKNLGARLTSAPWVAYLDADDAWAPTKLERQLARLEACPKAAVCYTLRTLMGEASEPLPTPQPTSVPEGDVLERIFAKNFVCFSSVMIARTALEAAGGFDPEFDLAIDYDLWLRVARHGEFCAVAEPLVRYRTGHGNLSKKLADRVLTADAIMARAVTRRGLSAVLPSAVVAEGFASTYRALAYTLRASEPSAAARWYGRALALHGSRQREALRGLAATLVGWARGRRTAASAENAAVNR